MQPNSILQLEGESPGPRQAAASRDAVAPFWDFAIRKEDLADFRGESRVQHLGNAIVCRARASGLRFVREPALVARMGVDHIVAHMRVSGQSRVAVGGGSRTARRATSACSTCRAPSPRAPRITRPLTVVLPRPLFGAREGALDALHGAVIRGETPSAGCSTSICAPSARTRPDSRRRRPQRPRRPRRCCSARRPWACRGTRGPARRRTARRSSSSHPAVHRGRAGRPDLNAETLGRRFGVSRSALYRLFAPLGGVSGYIRQRRLARAYADLAAGDGRFARISEVAYRWGSRARAFRPGLPRRVRLRPPGRPGPDGGQARRSGSAEAGSAAVPPARTETWADFYDWVLKLAA